MSLLLPQRGPASPSEHRRLPLALRHRSVTWPPTLRTTREQMQTLPPPPLGRGDHMSRVPALRTRTLTRAVPEVEGSRRCLGAGGTSGACGRPCPPQCGLLLDSRCDRLPGASTPGWSPGSGSVLLQLRPLAPPRCHLQMSPFRMSWMCCTIRLMATAQGQTRVYQPDAPSAPSLMSVRHRVSEDRKHTSRPGTDLLAGSASISADLQPG